MTAAQVVKFNKQDINATVVYNMIMMIVVTMVDKNNNKYTLYRRLDKELALAVLHALAVGGCALGGEVLQGAVGEALEGHRVGGD